MAGPAPLIVMASVIVVFRIAARSDAASILRDFPEVLLMAAVEKHPAANPRTCLVHVRQAHALDPATQMLSGRPLAGHFLEDVRRVQAEIYELLQALVRTHGVREVWCEALGPENEENINETYRSLRDFWLNGPRDSSKWQRLDEKLSLAAVKRLILEGVIEARGAETFETNQAGIRSMGKFDGDLRRRDGADEQEILLETHQRSEDIALEMIARAAPALAILVFGGSHDFRDNVASWNREHPEQAFAFVEITPHSFLEAYWKWKRSVSR